MNKKKLSFIFMLLAVFVLALGLSATSVYASKFYDVSDDFWAEPYISNLESRGIISGYGDGYFMPENNVQRCEYAKMLVNASGTALSSNRTCPFADVDVNEWYFPYINSVTNIMSGYQSTTEGDERIYFKPLDDATREDVTVALIKIMGYDLSEYYPVSDDLLSDVFSDYESIAKQDRPYIAEAVKRGYITGTQEGTFLGSDPITRCEVSAVLYRAFPEDETAYINIDTNEPDELLSGSFSAEPTAVPEYISEQISASVSVTVHYLDVGQGDSEFIELPDGRTMLIDASTKDRGDDVCAYIQDLGYTKIDYLIATHPHADHIGGMTEVVNTFEIGALYLPDAVTTTKTYENFLSAVLEKGIPTTRAAAGVSVFSENGCSAEFLAPCGTDYDDLNNYSAVLRLCCGNNTFLFMGDAEAVSETEMMASSYSSGKLKADVLKVGHHGSRSSTSAEFLSRVSPQYAVISCGSGNSYGHPHDETLAALAAAGVTVYRTDTDGTIVFKSDGNVVNSE